MSATLKAIGNLRPAHATWLGAAMLIHFCLLLTLKISRGIGPEMLWMSHLALGLAGLGLMCHSALLLATALTSIAALHTFWLIDFSVWVIFDCFLLGIPTYLPEADLWTWLGTSHHFYLLPLLLVLVVRSRTYPRAALPAAIALYLFLTLLCRVVLVPPNNVNWAFGVFPTLDLPIVHWCNRLPGPAYLLSLNAFVTIVLFTPSAILLRRLTRREKREKNGHSKVRPLVRTLVP